ncbi:30S ribosomal protein S9 [Patescibacteria group bacterium]|nr:30S ribosomal protein S9 [Patescibacteria group bacterium]
MESQSATQFKGKYYYGTGRRKTSTARVRLYEGSGKIIVNGKTEKDYFHPADLKDIVLEPLVSLGMANRFDISVKASGGGVKGQAGAIRLGVARALLELDSTLRPALKVNKFLTRDPRAKERKKYGLKGARRAPQFSKR